MRPCASDVRRNGSKTMGRDPLSKRAAKADLHWGVDHFRLEGTEMVDSRRPKGVTSRQ